MLRQLDNRFSSLYKKASSYLKAFFLFRRSGGIRTHDPLHPMQVRYRTAPHSETRRKYTPIDKLLSPFRYAKFVLGRQNRIRSSPQYA